MEEFKDSLGPERERHQSTALFRPYFLIQEVLKHYHTKD